MGQAMTSRFTGLSVGNARVALLGVVSLVVVAVGLALVLAGVTNGEVAATLLFLPVFAAGFLGGRPVGYAAAAVATLVYVALRSDDLSAAGVASAGVLALTRAGAYLVVGHVGALARVLVPETGSDSGASRSAERSPRAAERRRAPGERRARTDPAGPDETRWDQVWGDETDAVPARGRREPVLAGVGSAPGAGMYGDEDWGGQQPTTAMSGGWPPEQPPDPWADDPRSTRPSPRDGRSDTGGWDAQGNGWQGGHGGDGWQGGATGQHPAAPWQAGDETRPAEDDSWEAVQQSWRQQHGLPPEDVADGPPFGDDERPGWPYDAPVGGDEWTAPAPAGQWDDPRMATGGHVPVQGANGWSGAPAAGAGWAEQAPPGPDPWSQGPPTGGVPAASDPWSSGGPAEQAWFQAPPESTDRWPAAPPLSEDAWPAAPAPGGGWADQGAPGGDLWSHTAEPAPAQGGWGDVPPEQPQAWGSPSEDAWSSHSGQTEAIWDDPAVGNQPAADPWATPAGVPPTGAPWPAAGAFDTGRDPVPPAAPEMAHADLPAVDPETGLWTAKFLRDRLSSERERSRRTGHPFSLVLVQVPDGPLAQLPYRRQLTLLRELGYQFVAGGVVDHLVHVPDQAQHWFAVILPDTDRSGAQVLERRLRLGIGGYLSSRGLRLRDLESASLTAPDDDPAMGAIWEGLIGPDGAGSGPSGFGY